MTERTQEQELRDRYSYCRRQEALRKGLAGITSPDNSGEDLRKAGEFEGEAKAAAQQLIGLRQMQGEKTDDLERFFEFEDLKAEYSRSVYQRFAGFGTSWDEIQSLRESFHPRLQEFCLSAGMELSRLNDFYRDVEEVLLSLMPK